MIVSAAGAVVAGSFELIGDERDRLCGYVRAAAHFDAVSEPPVSVGVAEMRTGERSQPQRLCVGSGHTSGPCRSSQSVGRRLLGCLEFLLQSHVNRRSQCYAPVE